MIKLKDQNNEDIYIIGSDGGYANVKTANSIIPTGVTAYDVEPIFSGNIFEQNGKFYHIGENHKEFIADKTQDDDYRILTLVSIAKSLKPEGITDANVHIATGLPLTWLYTQRDSFKKYLTQKEEEIFKWNGTEYHIHIKGCSVYPQGYPAVLDRLKDFRGTNVVADIGNATMNIIFIKDKKVIESKCYTEKLGVNQCVIATKAAVSNQFAATIDEAPIQSVLRFGKADITDSYLNCIKANAVIYAESIFACLRKYEYNPDLMRLYIVGGGGCIIKNFGKYDKDRVTFIDDICATAKGYEKLVYKALTRKKA